MFDIKVSYDLPGLMRFYYNDGEGEVVIHVKYKIEMVKSKSTRVPLPLGCAVIHYNSFGKVDTRLDAVMFEDLIFEIQDIFNKNKLGTY